MLKFTKPPRWSEMEKALGIEGVTYPGVSIDPIYPNSWALESRLAGVRLTVAQSWASGRARCLRRALKFTTERTEGGQIIHLFDDDAFNAKLAELIPIGAESVAYAKERDEAEKKRRARKDEIGRRINAESPTGNVYRASDEWLLSEKPKHSTRFALDRFTFTSDGSPVFDLLIRDLTEEQLMKLLKEVP